MIRNIFDERYNFLLLPFSKLKNGFGEGAAAAIRKAAIYFLLFPEYTPPPLQEIPVAAAYAALLGAAAAIISLWSG